MRRTEVGLLSLAGCLMGLAALALVLSGYARFQTWNWEPLGLVAGWVVCAGLAGWLTRRALPRHDPYLLPIAYLLSGWGLLLIWRLAPGFGWRQLLWLGVSTLALIGVGRLPGDLHWLRRFRYTWLSVGILLTALTLFFGVNPSGVGQALWLGGLGAYFQPAELLKLLLVVFLASYLAEKREQLFFSPPTPGNVARAASWVYLLPMLLMWGFSLLLLLIQRDLGMSTLFFSVFIIMLYLASGQTRYVVVGVGFLLLAAVVGYNIFGVVRLRVAAWWDPWADATGNSYQIVQSLIALAAGGLLGSGPGLGFPGLIPVAHSDFIFSTLVEEWGLVGALGMLALQAALVTRGLRLALVNASIFNTLLAGGLAALLGLPALIILGGTVRLIPLTGLTLPFMSYGGSALLVNFVVLGLLLHLSSRSER